MVVNHVAVARLFERVCDMRPIVGIGVSDAGGAAETSVVNGHEVRGLKPHIEDLSAMFVYAPDTKIKEHPIRICSGDYTAVTGILTGTFSRPMPAGNGKTVAPTGKAFRLPMATIGHWKGNTMDHEWLFWDNHAYLQQIGLAQ